MSVRKRNIRTRKYRKIIIPHDYPLSNIELKKYARQLKIPYFRGVFMRNSLPEKIRKNEKGIINLDGMDGPGTHWVAYKKNGSRVIYFDSFGNLPPTLETISYFNSSGPCVIQYNYNIYQKFSTVNCGQLCLYFLIQ